MNEIANKYGALLFMLVIGTISFFCIKQEAQDFKESGEFYLMFAYAVGGLIGSIVFFVAFIYMLFT